jgi:uncharacterized protein (DUF1778 family)
MATKDQRRELRLSADDDELITEAAGLLGVSVSEFLLERAVADAEAIVEAHRTVRLNQDSYRRFLAALDAPIAPLGPLIEQIRKARTLKHAEDRRVSPSVLPALRVPGDRRRRTRQDVHAHRCGGRLVRGKKRVRLTTA